MVDQAKQEFCGPVVTDMSLNARQGKTTLVTTSVWGNTYLWFPGRQEAWYNVDLLPYERKGQIKGLS